MTKRNTGFTLIELLVVISIMSILISTTLLSVQIIRLRGKNSFHVQNLAQLKIALELYAHDHGGKYPVINHPHADGIYLTNNPGFTMYTNGGQPAGTYSTTTSSWIPGLVAGGYISKLPDFVSAAEFNQGICIGQPTAYYYRSDNGANYKIIARCPPGGLINQAMIDPVRTDRAYMICGYPSNDNGSGGTTDIACSSF